MKPRDKELKALLREHPDDLAALREMIELLMESERFDEATKWIAQAIKVAPDDPTFVLLQADVSLANGELEACEEAIDAAETLGADVYGIDMVRAALAASHDDPEEAANCYERALESRPDDMDAMFGLAAALEVLDESEDAMERYEAVLKADPSHVDARLGVGRTLMALGRFDRAKFHFEKAAAERPSDPEAICGVAEVLFEMGSDEEALATLERFLEAQPDAVDALALISELYDQLQYADDAIAYARRWVKAAPEDPIARNRLAQLLWLDHNEREAVEQARRVLALDSDDLDARMLLAQIAVSLEQREEAERHLDVIDAVERNPSAMVLRGMLERRDGKLAQAIELAEEAIEESPDLPEAWELMRDLLEQQGSMVDACDAARHVVRVESENADARLCLGRLLLMTGDRAGAEAELQELDRLDPEAATLLRDALQRGPSGDRA